MDPVNAEIGECNEQWELYDAVVRKRLVGETIIQLCITPYLGDQKRGSQKRHDGHRSHGLCNLHGNLVFEELRVFDGSLVPDENIRQCCRYEIGDKAEYPDNQEEAQELAIDVVPRPSTHVRVLRGFQINQVRGRFIDEGLGCAEEGQCVIGRMIKARERN